MTVNLGYDLHTIRIAEDTFAQIQRGDPRTLEGHGFPVEGALENDQLAYNNGEVGNLMVFTDHSRESYDGKFADDMDLVERSFYPRALAVV